MPLTATNPRSATDLAPEVLATIDGLLDRLDGQVLVSQNRWVDNLLDLYNQAPNVDLRREITAGLDAIRHRCSVKATDLRDHLLAVATTVEVESAFDDLMLVS